MSDEPLPIVPPSTPESTDEYTRRTRPLIARQSWYLSGGYAIVANACDAILGTSMFHWEVYVALVSPALSYIGIRGLEKWKNGGAR